MKKKDIFLIRKTLNNMPPTQPFSKNERCAPSTQEGEPTPRKTGSAGKKESARERHAPGRMAKDIPGWCLCTRGRRCLHDSRDFSETSPLPLSLRAEWPGKPTPDSYLYLAALG